MPQYSVLTNPNPQGVFSSHPGEHNITLDLPVKGLECLRLPIDCGRGEEAEPRILFVGH